MKFLLLLFLGFLIYKEPEILILPTIIIVAVVLIYHFITKKPRKNQDLKKEYYSKENHSINKTHEKLLKMKNKWEELNIVSDFVKVHHFADEKFKSNPPTLRKHYDYCINNCMRGENMQTLERCLKVTELLDDGLDINNAIEQSWVEYRVLRN